jgi:hypothetical protein
LRKLVQIICAVVLLDRGQQYDPISKRTNWKGFIEFELYQNYSNSHIQILIFWIVGKWDFISELCSTQF